MNLKNAISLSILPVILLYMTGTLYHYQSKYSNFPAATTGGNKYSALINGINSGAIHPSNEQIISLLKAEENMDKAQMKWVGSTHALIDHTADLIGLIGIFEIGLVIFIFREGRNRSSAPVSS